MPNGKTGQQEAVPALSAKIDTIGIVANLQTTAKTDLAAAINEMVPLTK